MSLGFVTWTGGTQQSAPLPCASLGYPGKQKDPQRIHWWP